MSSLTRKMYRASTHTKTRAARRAEEIHTSAVPGIFCDCYGTLFSFNFDRDEALVAYLNAQYAKGTEVTLVSTNPRQVLPSIRGIGLHPDIVDSLTSKNRYHNSFLEVLIDDDPVGLKAARLYDPKSPEFRKMLKEYLQSHPAAQPAVQP